MESSTYSGNGNLAKALEDELMKFTKKDEDHKVDATSNEQTGEIQRCTQVEINITECTQSSGNKLFEEVYHDTTESSSSFDGSSCVIENVDSLDDSEGFCDDVASALKFGGFDEKFMTRRKLTTHWRSFIQPLVWRCKWIELRIKKLQSQAQKYDRNLEAHSNQKQTNLENATPDNGMESLLFAHTNARVNTDGGFCSNDDPLSSEPGNHENNLERLLWKIYCLQSQVGKLKGRDDRVMTENAGKLSFSDVLKLPTPCNASTSTSGDTMPVGTYIASQLISEHNMGDVRVIDSAVTSHGDLPDANSRKAHAYFANAYKNHNLMYPTDDQPPPKIHSLAKLTGPNSKRRRREGAGQWSRRAKG